MSFEILWLFFYLLDQSIAPPQFLPSSCPLSALLCFTLLSSAPALFLPCSCFSPTLALLQPWSCPAGPAHPSLAAFIIIISTLRHLSARRKPPFMVMYSFRLYMSFLLSQKFDGRVDVGLSAPLRRNHLHPGPRPHSPASHGYQGPESGIFILQRVKAGI